MFKFPVKYDFDYTIFSIIIILIINNNTSYASHIVIYNITKYTVYTNIVLQLMVIKI